MVLRGSTTRRGIAPSPPTTAPVSVPASSSPKDEELIRRRQRFALTKSKLTRIIEVVAFMAGFSVVAIAELQIPETPNQYLLTAFVIITCLLASCCGFVIMVTAWILPHLRADEELDFVLLETKLVKKYTSHRLFKIEKQLRYIVQCTWIVASVGSVFLFTLDVMIVFWIKFNHLKGATIGATAILSPVLLILLFFGIFFRKKLIKNELFEIVPEDDHNNNDYNECYDNNNDLGREYVNFKMENERYLEITPIERKLSQISIGGGTIWIH